jgi:hypothetical protein
MKLTKLAGILILLSFISPALGLGIKAAEPTSKSSHTNTRTEVIAADGDAHNVSDISYVWQQVNGLCHWASLTMALQHVGVSLDLATLCAVSGIGFSAFYLQHGDEMVFYNGPMFRQMVPHSVLADFYGLNITLAVDGNNSEHGANLAYAIETMGVEYVSIDGWNQAFSILKASLDEGHPVELMMNPYYLPHPDYDFIRDLGLAETNSGHSVVATGYNENEECVYLADPGIGIMNEDYGRPLKSEWCYSVNYTSLDAAWNRTYGMFIVKPGNGPTEGMQRQIGEFILGRLQGDRASYIAGSEDLFFISLGADAFRGLAYDLTGAALAAFFENLGDLTPQEKGTLLRLFGLDLEQHMTLQYVSYKGAIQSVQYALPDLDLQNFVESGSDAFEHFDPVTCNTSLNDFFYQGGGSNLTGCFHELAYQVQFVTNGDIEEACTTVDNGLSEIRGHLMAIADSWDHAAYALERVLSGESPLTTIAIIGSAIGIVALVTVLVRRRQNILLVGSDKNVATL